MLKLRKRVKSTALFRLWSDPLRRKILIILLGLLITLLGFYLRLQKFDQFPPLGDTYDEVKGAFNGINLIQKGIPMSWSYFEEYKDNSIVKIRDTEFRIVRPYFDDPPLYALISGAYAISKNMTDLHLVDIGRLRYPMLKIGALNIFLLFLVIFLIRNPLEAILASIIYATVPTFVLSSRLAVADNALVTTSLASLLFLSLYIKKKNTLFLVICSLIAASSILIKSTGIFIPIFVIFLLILHKDFKAIRIPFLLLVLSVLTWFGYGFYYDFPLFLKLLDVYSGRELWWPSPIIGLFNIFRIGEKMMAADGWLIWGWICFVVLSFIKSEHKNLPAKYYLPIIVGCFLVFFEIMSGHSKGWYRFPIYPFLAWAMASVYIELVKNPKFIPTLFFLSLPIASSYIYGNNEAKWGELDKKKFQLLFPLIMSFPLFYLITQKDIFKKITQLILICAFILSIILNIKTVLFYQENFWY